VRSDCTHGRPTRRFPHGASATLARRVAYWVVGLGVLAAASGCALSPSYSDLAKNGRGVPVPAGLTYLREDAFTNQSMGRSTKEVNIIYANPTLTCDELKQSWIGVLTNAHRSFDRPPAGASQILLKQRDLETAIGLGLIGPGANGDCTRPFVATEEKPGMVPVYFFFAKPLWTAGSLAAITITLVALVAAFFRRRNTRQPSILGTPAS
jgi:hypothetical protein